MALSVDEAEEANFGPSTLSSADIRPYFVEGPPVPKAERPADGIGGLSSGAADRRQPMGQNHRGSVSLWIDRRKPS